MRGLASIFLIFSIVFTIEKPYVLIISFDGFRYDYMTWLDTPNFDYIEKMGVKADGLIPVFPSLTFPNHYSIATGSYSGNHNITGNIFYDKALQLEYSLYNSQTVQDPRFYKSEPIWVTAEQQGVKTASYFWVGTEAPIKGISPSITKNYDGSVPFKSRIDSVISWFELEEKKRPQLILLYFSEPDHTGHKYGVDKNKIIESVAKMDSLLGYLHQELKKLKIYSQLNLIITSDHGMANVDSSRLIILDDYITDLKYFNVMGSGSHVQFEYSNLQKTKVNKFIKELKNIPNSQAWDKSDIPKRFNYINSNINDYLLLANEGWFITTQSNLDKKKFSLLGMHGYDPININMHGIFYAMGSQIKSGLKIHSFENIHIYPLICQLLKINPYSSKLDGPDGDLEILKNIILDYK